MNAESLWAQLPAAMRARDEQAGGLLRALVEVLAAPASALEREGVELRDDWFIETCAEWVVPYIGELVGTRALHPLAGTAGFSNRARVADMLRFRRRKGTTAMLEELARVATGWPAHAVEFFERISTTQHMNHLRPDAPATACIRDAGVMELVGGPFDPTAHSVDVRAMDAVKGWHNLPNIGLFVWPVPSYPLDRATAVALATPADGRWFADPLGIDRPLFGPSVAERSIDQRSSEANLPAALRRRPLRDELAARRAGVALPATVPPWFGEDDPAFTVWIQDSVAAPLARVPLADLFVCDLSDWALPTGSQVRLDPRLGRVTVAAARPVHRLALSWSYGFGGDLGAGPFPRREAEAASLVPPDWQIGVSATDPAVPGAVVATLVEAVVAWHAWQAANPDTVGRIVLMDSHRYAESLNGANRIEIGQGSRLSLLAARWPESPEAGPRRMTEVVPERVRPCLAGNIEVVGAGSGGRPGQLVLDGLLIAGRLQVAAPAADEEGLGRLELRFTTLVPAAGGCAVAAGNNRLEVALHRSICGPLALPGDGIDLSLVESVVDGAGAAVAIAAPGAEATAAGATVLGTADLLSLEATDCIFDDVVTVVRRQQGCVRFSYVTPGSATPRRYRCQPDLAMAAAPGDPAVAARLEPAYVSDELANAGYARLAERAAPELRTGAESGAEMGAWRFLLTPQRLANLAAALDEFLPFSRVAAPLPVLPIEGGTP